MQGVQPCKTEKARASGRGVRAALLPPRLQPEETISDSDLQKREHI